MRFRALVTTALFVSLACWTGPAVRGQAKNDETKNDETKNGKNGNSAASLQTIKAEYRIPERIRQLLQDRNYADAVKAIDEAATQPGAAKDYLTFLKARALHLQQKYDDAIAAFEALAKDHPKSAWARRATFWHGRFARPQRRFSRRPS